ncbi:MAG: multiprotein bridging factor aMBF1 [Halobacteriales archaeon]
MVQCEMCGAETASPRTAKIEGAELEVCDDCVEFGTEVRQEPSGGSSTKYSTGSSTGSGSTTSGSGGTSGSTAGGTSGGSGGRSRRRDPFEDLEELDPDYDAIIRQAREQSGLSREELGRQLNEKASLIGKFERGESLPSDDVRRKLERALDIDLVAGGAADEGAEWSGGEDASGMTLGDVVERKD